MLKVFILGLDGATFDVLEPLFAEDKLPNLRQIVSDGVSGRLESVIPPITAPAWTSMATGKNPGKTGAFDFITSEGSYETRAIGSTHIRRGRAYWDYLSDNGARVGILNYPALYPPYKVNGFMVSGLPRSPEENITYPPELKKQLFDNCGSYKIYIPYKAPRYTEDPYLFVQEALELLTINEQAIKLLIKQKPDIFTVVISATDFAQHLMWRYIDETHPLYQAEEAEKYKPAFVQIWQRVDQIVRSILEMASGDTDILVVSDHGFGPIRGHFYTNTWLEQAGLLHRRQELKVKLRSLAGKAIKRVKGMSPSLHAELMKRTKKYVAPFTHAIDMKRSLAYAAAHSSGYGAICINTSEESPIRNIQDYETAKHQIIEQLKNTCASLNLEVEVYLSTDIYSGEYVKFAPDILFAIDGLACLVHGVFNKESYSSTLNVQGMSGAHRRDGILIAHGPDIKKGTKIQDASIYDIAPTILHMFGLPVPRDIDGRVLKEVFREDSEVARRPVNYREEDESERVRRRIKALKDIGKL